MSNLISNGVKKYLMGILLASLFVTVPLASSAVTIAELQAMIAQLQAQLRALQQQESGQTWCHTFNVNLGMGSYGNDAQALDQALQKSEKIENTSYKKGARFFLSDDGVFIENTAAAVVRFQKKYGILQTGYVGPLTRAQLNKLYGCVNNCPQYAPPAPGWCSNGTIVSQKNSNGCSHAICVNPSSVTINSISGPTSLNVGQTGTWKVNVTAPSNTSLTYSVDWGDRDLLANGLTGEKPPLSVSQSSTFTHSYPVAGTYIVKVTVKSSRLSVGNCPTNVSCDPVEDTANASITVVVGNSSHPSVTVTSPIANSRVTFPLVVTGIINNTNRTGASGWGMFEGEAGDAQLYFYNGFSWQAIGTPAIMKVDNWMTTITRFNATLNFNNNGVGLQIGAPMKIIFGENDPSGLRPLQTFELPIVFNGIS